MGWLIGWLIFGLAAVHEIGQLARQDSSEVTQAGALLFMLASVFGLVMVLRVGVREPRPALLAAQAGLAGLGALFGLVLMYGIGMAGEWITTALALTAYLLACLVIGLVCWAWATRRQRAKSEQEARLLQEREHLRRLERVRAEAAAAMSAADGSQARADVDFSLPQRPKWEDDF